MNKILRDELQSVFGAVRITTPENTRVIINAKKDTVLPLLRFLKEKGYQHLALISCVDWIEAQELEMVYILSAYLGSDHAFSDKEQTNVILKTRISRENPEFQTVIPVFQNAEPYERELHELYGIRFKNHPRLVPLFLDREYSIPPFRKDFDTRRYVKEVFDQVPFVDEEAEKV